ncbi:unnamed protein product, partial [Heterosigma akashiwo]
RPRATTSCPTTSSPCSSRSTSRSKTGARRCPTCWPWSTASAGSSAPRESPGTLRWRRGRRRRRRSA